MKENDYYRHYKAFVKELSRKPDQTLQVYCLQNGVVWRRLYVRMRFRVLFGRPPTGQDTPMGS